MSRITGKVLLIGYGNPGRLDDGLGPAVAEMALKMNLPDLTVEQNYQLNVEDAQTVAGFDAVIFADASVEGDEPFTFRKVEPKATVHFSTHQMEPEGVLALAGELFGAKTQGFVLAVRGYEFNEFGERLSGKAAGNLEKAAGFLKWLLEERNFLEI